MSTEQRANTHLPPFERVTASAPCVICGREKYCMLSRRGDFALCTKYESDRPIEKLEGWMHFIAASQRPSLAGLQRRRRRVEVSEYLTDFSLLQARHIAAFSDSIRDEVAASLGVDVAALNAFPLGWKASARALAIPAMKNLTEIVGIRYRRLVCREGQNKWWCETGSRCYPLLPTISIAAGQPLFVTEGPSDCMAATHLGLSACGRWSKDLTKGAPQVVLDHAARVSASAIVVCGDNDRSGGGEKSAVKVAEALHALAPWITVQRVQPPTGIKDLREWAHRGATASSVIQAVRNLEP